MKKVQLLFFVLALMGLSCPSYAKIYVLVSVDWEGRDLSEYNLNQMKNFRSKYPQIPLLHFISAAYWTKASSYPSDVNAKISSVLKPIDEIGLHVHSWKSLIENVGVNYRHFPKWTPSIYHQSEVDRCYSADCGHEVPLWAYQPEEIKSILEGSVQILKENLKSWPLAQFGFNKVQSFRAGGWMADSKVQQSLFETGFMFDSSEVSPKLFKNILNAYQIPAWVTSIWPSANLVNQGAYPLISKNNHTLYEMSDNGCLADYMSAGDMLSVFKENAKAQSENPNKDFYVTIGFHQETASSYLRRVEEAIILIQDWAQKNNVAWDFLQLPLEQSLLGRN